MYVGGGRASFFVPECEVYIRHICAVRWVGVCFNSLVVFVCVVVVGGFNPKSLLLQLLYLDNPST